MNFKGKMQRKSGITLISLVVTIIVLLILAGVTIATLTGNNGLLNRASEAKEKTQIASEDELRNLTILEATTHLEEYEYEDPSGAKITIPAKCAVSQVEGENTLEDGLVIIDANGNEWVWIETPEEVTIGASSSDEILEALNNYAIDYRLDYNTDVWYDGCGLTEKEYNAKKEKMLYSIKENNGFWIGRYETGSDMPRKSSSDSLTKVLIKQDKYPYNFVTVSQAQYLATNLSTNEYTCSILFDIQWDLTLKFLEEKGAKNKDEIKINSSYWGNFMGNKERQSTFLVQRGQYSLDDGLVFNAIEKEYTKENAESVLLTTGASQRNRALNIYDLAGNVAEWTLGKIKSSEPSLYRGGSYKALGFKAYGRPNTSTDTSLSNIGFRLTLY